MELASKSEKTTHSENKNMQFFVMAHTGSIWSIGKFLPPLLRSLNVPCKLNKETNNHLNRDKNQSR